MVTKSFILIALTTFFHCAISVFGFVNTFGMSGKTNNNIINDDKTNDIRYQRRHCGGAKQQKQQQQKKITLTATESSTTELEPIYQNEQDLPAIVPKLIVFDLDNTLWTPELYQIRQQDPPIPGKDIDLFPAAKRILEYYSTHPSDSKLAIASRTNKGQWARQLLNQMEAVSGLPIGEIFDFVEIKTGSKKDHFANLRKQSGITYNEMLFFDDDRLMNLVEVSQLGVLCCHCPKGLLDQTDLFLAAMDRYSQLKQEHDARHWMGYILNREELGLKSIGPRVDEGRITTGVVKFFNPTKHFGFVSEDKNDNNNDNNNNSKQDFFFHESKIAKGLVVKTGSKVQFETAVDGKDRPSAIIRKVFTENDADKKIIVELPCFTMSQPFAALLLNGIKTVETRNNPMFVDLPMGTKVLLHCGRRDWKDMNAPINRLRNYGYTEKEIKSLTKLRKGFKRGDIIGIVTIGRSYQASLQDRQLETLQQKVIASWREIGKYCTQIQKAEWLPKPIPMKGNAGIYYVKVSKFDLPKDD